MSKKLKDEHRQQNQAPPKPSCILHSSLSPILTKYPRAQLTTLNGHQCDEASRSGSNQALIKGPSVFNLTQLLDRPTNDLFMADSSWIRSGDSSSSTIHHFYGISKNAMHGIIWKGKDSFKQAFISPIPQVPTAANTKLILHCP